MLRELLRFSAPRPPVQAGDTEAEGTMAPSGHLSAAMPVAAGSVEQASSLITSCARKQAEKRRAADSSCQGQTQSGAQVKRSRADAVAQVQDQNPDQDQEDGSTSDVSIDDQENLQQLTRYQQLGQPQHTVVRAACSTLGHMLAPIVGWVPAQGLDPQLQQQLQSQQLLVLQQQQQEQGQQQLLLEEPAAGEEGCAQEDALAWSDETVACSEEGLNPSSSSARTVSGQPSTANTGGHSLQSHPAYVQHQQHAQHVPQEQEQDQATLQPQQATYSVEGTAVTSAGNTAEDTDDVDYDEDEFDPFHFISSLGPVHHYVAPGRQPLLPRQTRACKQKTLVLDLDETLVHSTLDAGYGAGADFSFPVLFNGCEHMVHVRTRPHMQEFLERVAEMFEVVVFTASQKVYAEKLLNILDPQRTLIRHRIYRDSCVVVEGNYLKDLSVLGRDLCRCAIVDNSPQAFGFQLSNGIPIESWYDDPTDNELPALLPFLEDLAAAEVHDVRPAIQAKFNLGARVVEANQRLAAAAAAAMRQQRAHEQQEQQQAAALMAQVASAAAEALHAHPNLPGMALQMILQQPQHAQEQAA